MDSKIDGFGLYSLKLTKVQLFGLKFELILLEKAVEFINSSRVFTGILFGNRKV